jgi:hypothetical protein
MTLAEYLKTLTKKKQERWARNNLMLYVKLKVGGYDPEVDSDGLITAWIPERDLAVVQDEYFEVIDRRMIC